MEQPEKNETGNGGTLDPMWLIKVLSPLAIPLAFKSAFPDGKCHQHETILLLVYFTFMKIKYLWDDNIIVKRMPPPKDYDCKDYDWKELCVNSLIALFSLFAAVKILDDKCFFLLLIGLLATCIIGLFLVLCDAKEDLICAIIWWIALNVVQIVFILIFATNLFSHIPCYLLTSPWYRLHSWRERKIEPSGDSA